MLNFAWDQERALEVRAEEALPKKKSPCAGLFFFGLSLFTVGNA